MVKQVQNNPAARLYDLTKRLRSTSRDGPPAKLWAQVFEIPVHHDLTAVQLCQVVERILAFWALIEEAEAGINELEFVDFYWEVFPPLRRVVQTSLFNLRAKQSNLTGPITDETVILLRVMASEWGRKRPDPEVDDGVLEGIQAEAHELFKAVKRAQIDLELKRLILSLTAEIEQAIEQYRIGGPEGLKRALALIVGQASLNIELGEKAKADERARVWLTRLYNLVVKFSQAVRFANDTRKTIEAVTPFVRLLGAPDEIPPVDLR